MLYLDILVNGNMNLELQNKLFEKYPKIFPIKEMTKIYPMAMFGIECAGGWYNILDALCRQIQSRIDWRLDVNERIEQKKKEYSDYDQMPLELIPQVVATQVKEKYGTLRFYSYGGDDEIYGMIKMAEAMSATTCEICGNVGKLRGKSWVYTACDEHTKEEDK